MKYTKCADWCH